MTKRAESLDVQTLLTPPEGMVFFRVAAPSLSEVASRDDVTHMEETAPAEVLAAWKRTLEAQLLPLKKQTTVDGRPLDVRSEDLQIVMLDLSTRSNPIPMLYEHGAGPRGGLAAGWLSDMRTASLNEPDRLGLFATPEWTETATKEIRAKEWMYISPGFFGTWDEDGYLHPRVLVEASLTNIPAIDGMMPVAASVTIPGTNPDAHRANASVTSPVAETPKPKETPPMTEAEVKALLEAAMKTRDEEATKLKAENAQLAAQVTAFASKLDAMPEATRQTVEDLAVKRENERALASLVARATKAGIATADTKESFEKLARAEFDATVKMVERAEAVAKAPKGRFYRPDSPEEATSAEPTDMSTHEGRSSILTAALRRSHDSGQRVAEAVREVTR